MSSCRSGESPATKLEGWRNSLVAWITEQAGDRICLFSSDYPHVEGGRNPLGRFDTALAAATDDCRDRFYRANFEDLMGPMMAATTG